MEGGVAGQAEVDKTCRMGLRRMHNNHQTNTAKTNTLFRTLPQTVVSHMLGELRRKV